MALEYEPATGPDMRGVTFNLITAQLVICDWGRMVLGGLSAGQLTLGPAAKPSVKASTGRAVKGSLIEFGTNAS